MKNAWWKEAVIYQIYPRSFCDKCLLLSQTQTSDKQKTYPNPFS